MKISLGISFFLMGIFFIGCGSQGPSLEWQNAGFNTQGEVDRWIAKGINNPAEAGQWKKCGFSVRYEHTYINNPLYVSIWKGKGLTADEACEWKTYDIETAKRLIDSGFKSAEEYEKWRSR